MRFTLLLSVGVAASFIGCSSMCKAHNSIFGNPVVVATRQRAPPIRRRWQNVKAAIKRAQ